MGDTLKDLEVTFTDGKFLPLPRIDKISRHALFVATWVHKPCFHNSISFNLNNFHGDLIHFTDEGVKILLECSGSGSDGMGGKTIFLGKGANANLQICSLWLLATYYKL